MIIVLGVLIALGLDAWYEALVESRAEQVYLSQLIEDLRETERQIAAAIDRTAPSEQSSVRLLHHLRGFQPANADSVRSLLSQSRGVDNPVPVLGTAEALVATGDLRLIDSPAARAAITRWLSRSRDFWLVPLYQLEEQHTITFRELLHRADLAGVEPNDRGAVAVAASDRQRDRPPLIPDATRFAADPEVYSLLSDIAELKVSMLRYRRAMASEAAELRDLLEPLVD